MTPRSLGRRLESCRPHGRRSQRLSDARVTGCICCWRNAALGKSAAAGLGCRHPNCSPHFEKLSANDELRCGRSVLPHRTHAKPQGSAPVSEPQSNGLHLAQWPTWLNVCAGTHLPGDATSQFTWHPHPVTGRTNSGPPSVVLCRPVVLCRRSAHRDRSTLTQADWFLVAECL